MSFKDDVLGLEEITPDEWEHLEEHMDTVHAGEWAGSGYNVSCPLYGMITQLNAVRVAASAKRAALLAQLLGETPAK